MVMRLGIRVGLVIAGICIGFVLPARAEPPATAPAAGVLPVDAAGRPLNLDFESGSLDHWTATGDAFARQPVRGDTVHARRADMRSRHQGDFWVGSFEIHQDPPQGTLTSAAFTVTHPFASFLVGGGAFDNTRVELVSADDERVFFRTSGRNTEDMHRVVVDLRDLRGRQIFIRLIDQASGGWGHINFDDFRFHSEKPPVEQEVDLAPDAIKNAGLPPEEAARAITLPQGFSATLFAGEPDVNQPVGFAIDERGRLWVAEAWTYPVRLPDGQGKDRILIFEDTDGDGRADKRTVFIEGLNLVSGIEVGFGGVWVGAAPYLMFIPDRDRDDKPDGEPQILLDGWAWQDTHETLNAFIWGPDGWLYGCHGVFTHSRVGKPGTPDEARVPLNAAIWRYHPTKHVFEIFAEGTSNPWGVDFNDYGQAFATACVIPHLYHVIQGARYQRQAGQHFNPHVYADIQTCADHVHWAGSQPHAGNNKSDSAGGGHAHCGAMIYLGGAFPQQYRNSIFMGNIHGNRINNDTLEPRGSGYVGKHGRDFMLMNDAWSRLINMKYGPDGSVYVIDWYDKQACHHPDTEVWDRTNGRIYKVTYGKPERQQVDLSKLSNDDLVKLQLHENDYFVRQARRILQERGAGSEVGPALVQMMRQHEDPTRALRAMWALHAASGGIGERQAMQAFGSPDERVRAWAVQLACENGEPSEPVMTLLEKLAKDDPSPVVRLYVASALQRVPPAERWPVLSALVMHAEDAGDHNLPLMYWYAAEPAVAEDVTRGIELAKATRIPLLRQFVARRVASIALQQKGAAPDGAAEQLAKLLLTSNDPALHRDALEGIAQAFRGQSRLPAPPSWPRVHETLAASADADVRRLVQSISTTFGDERALDNLRRIVIDSDARPADRMAAVDSLVAARDPKLPPLLAKLLDDPAMRSSAVRGLAAFDDAEAARALVAAYANFDAITRTEALNTLASRASYANALRDAIDGGRIPAADITPAVLRQLHSLNDAEVNAWIGRSFGLVRTTPAEKLKEMQRYRALLSESTVAQADAGRGRAVFARTCMQCHTLFGAGGTTGPDLTGSDRARVDYILENVIDPSAVVGKQYLTTVISTKDGRVLAGVVKSQDENAVTLATETETHVVPRPQINRMTQTEFSMMPEGLFAMLKEEEVRDLVAYLRTPGQIPMLATPQNAASLFNGKDLTGWTGDRALWSVEDGEIVGQTNRLEKNAFLISDLAAEDFTLTVEVKLVGEKGNSGIQFRSQALPDGDVKGYQADIGPGWWGKLYEEHGRELLSNKSGETFVKPGEWNTYEIVASGDRITTKLNGHVCADLDDPKGARRGIFALQLHSGGPTEVRFRNLRLEVDER